MGWSVRFTKLDYSSGNLGSLVIFPPAPPWSTQINADDRIHCSGTFFGAIFFWPSDGSWTLDRATFRYQSYRHELPGNSSLNVSFVPSRPVLSSLVLFCPVHHDQMRTHCRVDSSKWWWVTHSVSDICWYRAALAANKQIVAKCFNDMFYSLTNYPSWNNCLKSSSTVAALFEAVSSERYLCQCKLLVTDCVR